MPVVTCQDAINLDPRSWAICHSQMVTTGPKKMCHTVPVLEYRLRQYRDRANIGPVLEEVRRETRKLGETG